jgi:hypothetical protein
MLSRKMSALVALSLMTASTAAVAQTAAPLSIANAAPAGVATDANELDSRNGFGIYIIGAVVLGLIVWGVIELTKSDDGPASP